MSSIELTKLKDDERTTTPYKSYQRGKGAVGEHHTTQSVAWARYPATEPLREQRTNQSATAYLQ